jgi:hypothetical protein
MGRDSDETPPGPGGLNDGDLASNIQWNDPRNGP